MTHRAREHLLALGREIPGIWAAYEEARAESSPREGVYITEADGAGAFAQALLDAQGPQALEALRRMTPLELARMVSPVTTMAAWRARRHALGPPAPCEAGALAQFLDGEDRVGGATTKTALAAPDPC